MKKLLSFLFVLMTLLFVSNALAYTAPPPPAHGGYVLDQTGRMSPSDIQQLNQKIDRISKATKNEFGCVLLQSLEGDTIEDAAGTIFHAWGIGKHGLDNGILIIVSLKDRKSRIETGKGVEGEVTDLQSNDILKQHLNPHLKRGDFAGGFSETVDTLGSLLESRANAKVTPVPTPTQDTTPATAPAETAGSSKSNGGLILLLCLGLLGVIGIAMWLSARSRERERLAEEERLERLRQAEAAWQKSQRAAVAARTQVSTPFVPVPEVRPSRPAPTVHHHTQAVTATPSRPLAPSYTPSPVPMSSPIEDAATVAAAAAAAAELSRRRRDEEEAEERRREERAAERRREQEEEDRRRRDDDDSSSSSGSSFDWGGGSSGGSDDSGSGFGGGDSGGGGSSSDW